METSHLLVFFFFLRRKLKVCFFLYYSQQSNGSAGSVNDRSQWKAIYVLTNGEHHEEREPAEKKCTDDDTERLGRLLLTSKLEESGREACITGASIAARPWTGLSVGCCCRRPANVHSQCHSGRLVISTAVIHRRRQSRNRFVCFCSRFKKFCLLNGGVVDSPVDAQNDERRQVKGTERREEHVACFGCHGALIRLERRR